jgi:hypothetical protein
LNITSQFHEETTYSAGHCDEVGVGNEGGEKKERQQGEWDYVTMEDCEVEVSSRQVGRREKHQRESPGR